MSFWRKIFLSGMIIFIVSVLASRCCLAQTNDWKCSEWLNAFLLENVYQTNPPPLHLVVQEEIANYMSRELIVSKLRTAYHENIDVLKEVFPTEEDYTTGASLDYSMQQNAERYKTEKKDIYVCEDFIRVITSTNDVELLGTDRIWKPAGRRYKLYNLELDSKKIISKSTKRPPPFDKKYWHYGRLSNDDSSFIKIVLFYLGGKKKGLNRALISSICDNGNAMEKQGEEGIAISIKEVQGKDRVQIQAAVRYKLKTNITTWFVDKKDVQKIYSSEKKQMPGNILISRTTCSNYIKLNNKISYPENILIEKYDKGTGELRSMRDINIGLVEIMGDNMKKEIMCLVKPKK